MENEEKKIKIIITVIIVIIALISATMAAEYFSDEDTYKDTIKVLDEKRNSVIAMSASSAAVSTGLTFIPGDVAEPIANELADLSSTLMIVLCAIFLEKYFLTISGLVTCRILIPLSCVLIIIFIWKKKDKAASIAAKLTTFGLCCMLLVPASTWTTSFIENTYNASIEQHLEEAEETADALNANADKEESTIEKFFSNIKGGLSETLDSAKNVLGNFIESAALLIITSCVIPILTLGLFLWGANMILGMNINVSKDRLRRIGRSGSAVRKKLK